jgi:hypothetical protein
VPRRAKKRASGDGFVETYKRIRKPMPPPERVIADRRRRVSDDEARREIEREEGRRTPSDET